MEHGTPLGSPDDSLADLAAVCRKVREAFEPARVHAVSLHDGRGELLWNGDDSLGPDEHRAMRDAIDRLTVAKAPPFVISILGDSRSAVVLRAVNARRCMVGAIMATVDERIIREAGSAFTATLVKLQRAAGEFAGMCPDGASTMRAFPPPPRRPPVLRTLVAAAGFTPMRPPLGSPQRAASRIDGLHAALRRSPISLHVQRLVPLVKSGPPERYEVLLRMRAGGAQDSDPRAIVRAAVKHGVGSMIDRRVIIELIGFLVRNPTVWQPNVARFSVNLTTSALRDESFFEFVALCLAKSGLPAGMIAFEVDTARADRMAGGMAEVAAAMNRLRCPLVLDDFALSTECFALLRLPGVCAVKLSPAITAAMRSDKLAQASITAVAQMARVLGMHTVAKRTEIADHEWLSALGVDFVQSNCLSPSVAIDSLTTVGAPLKP